MNNWQFNRLDEDGHGIELPERLFLDAFVLRQDLTREGRWRTGRASEPAYLQLNLHAARKPLSLPRVVVWQHDEQFGCLT